MFSLASSDTVTSIDSSFIDSRCSKPGPLLVAGQEPPRRRGNDRTDQQLLRLTGFKEEEANLMKTLFDYYDHDRDGKLTIDQACLLCTTLGFHPVDQSTVRCSEDSRVTFRQLVQTAGFVRAHQMAPATRGGHTKNFFRMANRNAADVMPSKQMFRFFKSIGVDIPPAAVDRMVATVSRDGGISLKEDELVEYVDRVQRRQDAVARKISPSAVTSRATPRCARAS